MDVKTTDAAKSYLCIPSQQHQVSDQIVMYVVAANHTGTIPIEDGSWPTENQSIARRRSLTLIWEGTMNGWTDGGCVSEVWGRTDRR